MDRDTKKYRTYNTKRPRLTIRLASPEQHGAINDAAKRAGISVSSYVLGLLESGSGQTGGQTTIDDRSRDDMLFLMLLFQRNKDYLFVTPDEIARVKQIVQRLKQ